MTSALWVFELWLQKIAALAWRGCDVSLLTSTAVVTSVVTSPLTAGVKLRIKDGGGAGAREFAGMGFVFSNKCNKYINNVNLFAAHPKYAHCGA